MEQAGHQMILQQFAENKESPRTVVFMNRHREKLPLLCKQLSEADYEEVRAFELEVMAGIPNNETENIYQPFDESGLRKALETGWAVGLYETENQSDAENQHDTKNQYDAENQHNAERLAAFLYVIPHPQPDHNVLMDVLEEAGLAEKEETDEDAEGAAGTSEPGDMARAADPGDVMIADCILVGKQYRGYGLQRALFYLADCLARQEGISRLCGTASPKNAHSIHNFEAAGYRCVAVKPKYRSVRCFFVKEIDS